MGDIFEPEVAHIILQSLESTPAAKKAFQSKWDSCVTDRVEGWKKQKDNKFISDVQLTWEAEVVEYINYLNSKTKVHGNASASTAPPKLSTKIPFYGPRFVPPSYRHLMRRNPTATINPDTAYLTPLTVVHPIFFPSNVLDVCPQCGTNDILWDSWNATGCREVHGLYQNERAMGYQLRCKPCRNKYQKGGPEWSKDGPGYCFSTVSATFWAPWEHWKIPYEVPYFLHRSAVTHEVFNLVVELRPSYTSAGLAEHVKQLHLLRFHQKNLEYLSYFKVSSATRNFFRKVNLQSFKIPSSRDGYRDSPLTNDLITEIYLRFVTQTRQPESIEFCQTRSAISLSLDNTFKSAGKAVVVDKDKTRKKLLKGGVLSVINEHNEIVVWRFCQSASPVEIQETLEGVKARHDYLKLPQPKVVVVDNCCQVRRCIIEKLPNTEVVLDVFHFVQRYGGAIINGAKNPYRGKVLSDIQGAILKQTASKQGPAVYYPKGTQEKRLVDAYEKWSSQGGVWSAAASKVHLDQLTHVRKGCLARTYQDIATDGSRIEGSHKGWNSLQRSHPSGLEVYAALAHDFVHRRNMRMATTRAAEAKPVNSRPFLTTTHDSHHTRLVNHIADEFNTLLLLEPDRKDLVKAPTLQKVLINESFGLVTSAHTLTFGGFVKEELETDESRLLSNIKERTGEVDQSSFYQQLGIDQHLFNIPEFHQRSLPSNTNPTFNDPRLAAPSRATVTAKGKRKGAPQACTSTEDVLTLDQDKTAKRPRCHSPVPVDPGRSIMDRFLGLPIQSDENMQNPHPSKSAMVIDHDEAQSIPEGPRTDMIADHETRTVTHIAVEAVDEATHAQDGITAVKTPISSEMRSTEKSQSPKSGLTRTQQLFSIATQVDPRALSIGRGMEFYLFMEMRAECGWASFTMSPTKWALATKAYNERLLLAGKTEKQVVVVKNPRALMEKLSAVEIIVCDRMITNNFTAKSSGTDKFWMKHCRAVPALLQSGDKNEGNETRKTRRAPVCGRCLTVMYHGPNNSAKNHKRGYCADGARQKAKQESADPSLPKWPQPLGIFATGTEFHVVKFLEAVQLLHEKVDRHATALEQVELSLEEASFAEMLQTRTSVTSNGEVYFKLYDLETIGGNSLIVEREDIRYLRVDFLAEKQSH